MKTIKMLILAVLTALTFLLLSCSEEAGGEITTAEPELTLGELPDYSGAHAENAPYIVFSSDLEPISEDRIDQVRKSLYSTVFQSDYAILKEIYDDDEALRLAEQNANSCKASLMNPENLLYDDYYTWVCNYASRYYGTVNGCEIICFSTFIDRDTACELGGVTLESPNPFYIYVCREKEFIPLSEAYERGWLMSVDILLIAKRNRDFNSYWEENYADPEPGYSYVKYIPELEELTDKMIEEIYDYLYSNVWAESYSSAINYIKDTYGDKYSSDKHEAIASYRAEIAEKGALYSFLRNTNTHDIGWRYYGIIGSYVVFAEVDLTNAVKKYKLGEYTISFANGAEMWVYSTEHGKVEIDEAYKNGLLTDADIAKISERHEAYHNYIFGETK